MRHASGTDTLTINMREPDEIHGGLQHGLVSWVRLGEYRFDPRREAYLAVRAAEDGRIYADAALFVPAGR